MATLKGSARRLRAAVDVVMHGTGGLTGELERRSADLNGQVAQLRRQVEALQAITTGLDGIRLEVAGLAGPSGRLVAAGSPWWSLLPFPAHRIQLAPGVFTADTGVEPHHDLRTKIVLHVAGGLAGKRVVDVGCNEGGFSVEFARHGATETVGIEARSLSVRRSDFVRDLLGLTGLRFVCGDVLHELARAQQPFDVVFATGILYHLSRPDVALRLMRERCCGVMVLCTHVAHPAGSTHGCSDQVVDYVGEHGTYRGRSYSERDVGPMAHTGGDDLWAAWGNDESFWPFEDDLLRMIEVAGFASAEKIDPGAHPEQWQVDQTHRVMYVCRV
jgi:SAM-dependent methyltransferase